MKTFLILTISSFCLTFSVQAQNSEYVPNARQAIQKSRMQQPQYLELTKDPVDNQQGRVETPTRQNHSVNYLLERPVAIDGPKRRSKKSSDASFARLASNSKK